MNMEKVLEKAFKNRDGQVAVARSNDYEWEVEWANESTTGGAHVGTTEDNLNVAIDQIAREFGDIFDLDTVIENLPDGMDEPVYAPSVAPVEENTEETYEAPIEEVY